MGHQEKPIADAEQIKQLYAKFRGAEGIAKSSNAARREAGIALGKALFDLRADAEVVPPGTTFDSTLKSLGIPHRTAYRWIKKYETSVGIRGVCIPVVFSYLRGPYADER